MAVERRSVGDRAEQLDDVSVERRSVAESRLAQSDDISRVRLQIGAAVVLGLLALIVAVLIAIAVFAVLTYPTPEEVKGTLRRGDNVREALQDDRTAWFTQIKDLLQLLVVSLLVPALTTILGYIFGREQADS